MGKKRKIKVLVVDSEEEFASTLTERLRLCHIEVESVFSGEEALTIIPRFMPDVMILDLQMPGTNSLNTLSQVKTFDSTIEVIILTKHGSVDAGITGMELGAFDYIIKPVDLVLLIEKITAAYEKKGKKSYQSCCDVW